MRRLLATVTTSLLLGTGLVVGAAPAQAVETTTTAAGTVDVVQVRQQVGTNYYCAVGVFVRFGDVPGYTPRTAAYTASGAPASVSLGEPPYSDGAVVNGIAAPPPPGKHQRQIGNWSTAGGGTPSVYDDCNNNEAYNRSLYGPAATITYERPAVCVAALTQVEKAEAKVAAAKKAVKKASGDKAKARAKAKLKKAKKKLAAAREQAAAACA